MKNYVITIDSSCDVSINELNNLNVPVIFIKYSDCCLNEFNSTLKSEDIKEFYKKMRIGVKYKTHSLNPNEYKDFFKEVIDKYHLPIIHISLGTGLSGTYNNALQAKEELESENKDYKIYVVDSKIASLGLGLLLYEGLKDEYDNVDEVYSNLLKVVPTINTYYTTDTLEYFARGGRLSKASAVLGNLLQVRPILACNEAGNLKVISKVRGVKNSYKFITEKVKDNVIEPENQTLYLASADCLDNTIALKNAILEQVPFKDYKIFLMGQVIGSHAGPGLSAVFFKGKERK